MACRARVLLSIWWLVAFNEDPASLARGNIVHSIANRFMDLGYLFLAYLRMMLNVSQYGVDFNQFYLSLGWALMVIKRWKNVNLTQICQNDIPSILLKGALYSFLSIAFMFSL